MRFIHTFADQKQAQRFADALYGEAIETDVREKDAGYDLWVVDDDEVENVKVALSVFLEDPADPRFDELIEQAKKRRSNERKLEKQSRHNEARARETLLAGGLGPVTVGLMLVCVVVAVVTQLGEGELSSYFMMTTSGDLMRAALAGATSDSDMRITALMNALSGGEVWRPLSPILLHLGFMHILFNLWWFKDLGGALERIQGSGWLAMFIVVVGVLANVTEYFFGSPLFGGMSGVVFGLFTYVWIRGRFDPTFRLGMPRSTVMWMAAWYFLCVFEVIPTVANWAHTGGLVVGGLWAFIDAQRSLRRATGDE